MDKPMKKKDNRGMSLVEIILVIALMMVIAGITGYGLSLIGQKPVEECARKVEIALNQNRTNSMGKVSARLEFGMTGNRVTVQEFSRSARESDERAGTVAVIGAVDVKLRFVYKNAEGAETIVLLENAEGGIEKVSFKRDSGSVVEKEGGLVLDRIEVYKGEGYVKTVSIDKLTGKVTLQ